MILLALGLTACAATGTPGSATVGSTSQNPQSRYITTGQDGFSFLVVQTPRGPLDCVVDSRANYENGISCDWAKLDTTTSHG